MSICHCHGMQDFTHKQLIVHPIHHWRKPQSRTSGRVGQQRHKTGPFDRPLRIALTLGAITAALTGENLAPLRQQLLQILDVFIIDMFNLFPAVPAFTHNHGTALSSSDFRIHRHTPVILKFIIIIC